MVAKRVALLVFGGMAVGALSSGIAAADSGFRCETGRLVDRGDRMYEVEKKCGAPATTSTRTERRKISGTVLRWTAGILEEVAEEREIDVLIDEWIYDLGSTRFVRFVSFENGVVTHVATGAHGSKR